MNVYQIIPVQKDFRILTIPDMSSSISDNRISQLWKSYYENCESIETQHNFYVDEDVLKGKPILEEINFDNSDWQALSYSSEIEDFNPKMYVISTSTILAIDPEILNVLDLQQGEWARRDSIRESW